MQDCARYVEEMTRLRREIHRRPEEGWTEFETQWKVFRALEALGWTIRMGLDVIRPEAVMGRNAELVEKAMVRAAEHGVPESFLKATGGYTGLTADFDTGCEGPVASTWTACSSRSFTTPRTCPRPKGSTPRSRATCTPAAMPPIRRRA